MTEAFTTTQVIYNFLVWCFALIVTWLDMDINMLTSFGVLLVFDYITGLGKAYHLGHSITSNKMKYGIVSKLSLIIVPLIINVAAKGLGSDSTILLDFVIVILILAEVYSIIGNIYSMRSGEEMPEYDAITAIGKRLRTVLIRMEGDKDDTL